MPSIAERWRALFRPRMIVMSMGGDAHTQVINYDARRLYQTQDNLKSVVDFMANSIAQLPLKTYRRDGETERVRDRDSTAARLLWRPNRDQTWYEFVRGLTTEYFIFGSVYAWLLPDAEAPSGYQLRIIPSEWVRDMDGDTVYAPAVIHVQASADSKRIDIPRDEFVLFRTYSPGNPGGFISPVSALRQTLQEQIEAANFRKELWHSSGRLNAQIIRPKDVQPWDDEQRRRWTTAFREAWGAGGSKAGSIPVMEDGMEIKPFQTSFKEQQWAESIKLSRESVAAAYGINPSLIWHSDTQTYASSKDNARALYAECLGPVLQMLQQRINSFLLPMVGADENTYVEFDLTEKLKGSFEERASILQSSVGGPWMTRNEARADNNLPPVVGGDELIVPLNVVEGGQASPTDTHMDEQTPMTTIDTEPKSITPLEKMAKAVQEIRIKGAATDEENEDMQETLAKFFKRQAASVLPKIGAGRDWWDEDRWNAELADDLEPHMNAIADAHGAATSAELGTEYDPEITRKYLRAMAEGRARATNDKTRDKLEDAIEDDDEEHTPASVMEKREETESPMLAQSLATAVAGWALLESVQQAERQGYSRTVEKEWVTGINPRESHALMNGERVPYDEPFSNGAKWPGDDFLGPDETCNCNCRTDVIIGG